ncbi:DUF3037 domain-containing protein [Ectobacillus ponti]|uniref:DUF3037 domain-containing protein n=1 Tax=Ectobacillus ponti TaxID=2961894 RepID=A0AA41XBY6_9BACI|nr:DUF3037 domain-containing protein [Ectobacillus ponti]MCP8970534.1 DUF3037 domain-containing protein [Ectobacillus ponti]
MERAACKFSVIQYMPDTVRQEVVNIGVIIHCPDRGIIQTRFLHYLQKVSKIMDMRQINEFRHFRYQFNRHLKELRNELVDTRITGETITFDYLDVLSQYNFNKFIIKKPQPLLTDDPLKKLNDLFNLFVYDEDHLEKREQPFSNTIWTKFKNAGIEKYVRKEVHIPEFPIAVDFGFQNGCANLIQTIKFGDNFKENFKEGLVWRDALQAKERSQAYKDSPFYAIVKPPSNPQKSGFSLALEQFSDMDNVEVIKYGTRQFDGLIDYIKDHGHVLH